MTIPASIPGPDGYEVLPVGRHKCSVDEMIGRFVTGTPDEADRQQILQDWNDFRAMQTAVGIRVRYFLVNGGFATGKVGTSDIDFVSVLDGSNPPPNMAAASPWLAPKRLYQSLPAPTLGRTLRVDAYAAVKVSKTHPSFAQFKAAEDSWDEFFRQLEVTGTTPVKGFLEVTP